MTKVINLRKNYKNRYKPISCVKRKHNSFNFNNVELIKIIITIFSLIFLFSGCVFYKNNNTNFINEFCIKFISNLQSESWLDIFIYLIKFDLTFLLATFFFGTSLVGLPLNVIPMGLKCFLIGCLSSFLYCEYHLRGVLYSLIFLYPFLTFTTTGLIYSANESIYMSKYIFKIITNKNTVDNISIRLYLLRYTVLFIINVLCVAMNSLLIVMLSDKLNLNPVA